MEKKQAREWGQPEGDRCPPRVRQKDRVAGGQGDR